MSLLCPQVETELLINNVVGQWLKQLPEKKQLSMPQPPDASVPGLNVLIWLHVQPFGLGLGFAPSVLSIK